MARNDPNTERPVAAAEAAANAREPMNVDPPVDIGTINRYVVREIDYGLDAAGELQFMFSNHALAATLPPNGIDQVIEELRAAQEGAEGIAEIVEDDPLTPLDLELPGRPIFIVLLLAKNMWFDPDQKAVNLKSAAYLDHYGGLMHANADETSPGPLADCKIIYFVAKPPEPLRTPYEHEFNFNVLMKQNPRPGVAGERAIKIELDPDIRFPGGSGIGEGP